MASRFASVSEKSKFFQWTRRLYQKNPQKLMATKFGVTAFNGKSSNLSNLIFVGKKARRNFSRYSGSCPWSTPENFRRAIFFVLPFVGIMSQIKLHLGPLVIQLVWYILKKLFTSVSVKVVDIYLAASPLGEYPPLITSTSVNNC